jgi:hypothetical protein
VASDDDGVRGLARRVSQHDEPVREDDRVDDRRAAPTRGLVGGESEAPRPPRALVPAAVH